MGSPAAGLAAGLAATWAAGLAAHLEAYFCLVQPLCKCRAIGRTDVHRRINVLQTFAHRWTQKDICATGAQPCVTTLPEFLQKLGKLESDGSLAPAPLTEQGHLLDKGGGG